MKNYRITYLYDTIHLGRWIKSVSAVKPVFCARHISSALNKFFKQKDEFGYFVNKNIPKSYIISVEVV